MPPVPIEHTLKQLTYSQKIETEVRWNWKSANSYGFTPEDMKKPLDDMLEHMEIKLRKVFKDQEEPTKIMLEHHR